MNHSMTTAPHLTTQVRPLDDHSTGHRLGAPRAKYLPTMLCPNSQGRFRFRFRQVTWSGGSNLHHQRAVYRPRSFGSGQGQLDLSSQIDPWSVGYLGPLAGGGGSRCRMSILRNVNVACLCHLKSPLSLVNYKKCPIPMSLSCWAPCPCH